VSQIKALLPVVLNPLAPLLLIAGTNDHIIPATMVKSNYHKYGRSKAITSFKEFPAHSHLIIAQDGWQQVAESALSWAQQHIFGGAGAG
jgi:alpha-beta hydrolase superfamily lysophospholipase